MSFSIGNLKFIDSIQFMALPLEKLIENLHNDSPGTNYGNFHFMKREFGDDIGLVCQKGFYPYEWMDDTNKLNQEGLPEIESFILSYHRNQYRQRTTLTPKMFIPRWTAIPSKTIIYYI